MSRDFEKEYRELAQMEAPDLWDRIEAGLEENPKKKATIMMIFRKYQAVAAAVLCLALIVPALLFMKPQGVKSEAAMEEAAEEAPAEVVWEAPAEEATAELMAGGADKAPAEMMADSAAVTEGEAEAEESIDTEAVTRAETEEALATVESAKTEAFNKASSKLKDDYSSDAKEAALVLTNVTIKIIDSTEFIYEQENGRPGVIYRCEVVSYHGDELKEGEMISVFFVPAYSQVFEKDSIYEVDLVWQDKENYSYQIEFVYE